MRCARPFLTPDALPVVYKTVSMQAVFYWNAELVDKTLHDHQLGFSRAVVRRKRNNEADGSTSGGIHPQTISAGQGNQNPRKLNMRRLCRRSEKGPRV